MARTLQSVLYWNDVNFFSGHGFISSGFCPTPGSLQFPFAQFIPADLTGDGLWECYGDTRDTPANVQHCIGSEKRNIACMIKGFFESSFFCRNGYELQNPINLTREYLK